MSMWRLATPPDFDGIASVYKVDDDGTFRSCLVTDQDYLAWVAAGNQPEAYAAQEAEPITADMVRAEGARRLAIIGAPYSPEERETWSQQVMEAKAVQADANADAPLLTLLAAADSIPVADMAATVLSKAEAFAAAAGAVLAAQRALLAMDSIPADYATDSRWLAE